MSKNSKGITLITVGFIAILIVAVGVITYNWGESRGKEDNLAMDKNDIANTVGDEAENTDHNEATYDINNDVTYDISVKDECIATIKATKNGKTTTTEFRLAAAIDNTDIIDIKNIGKVAIVADTGGEYYGVTFYQLVGNEIKSLGKIDCSADMIKDAAYTVETRGEDTAIIKATRNGTTTTKEFEMNAAIADTNVINILDRGKVVLVAETGGEYYGIQVYRLTQNYITGETIGIKKVGFIEANFN